MPNWCMNRLTLNGPEPVITKIKDELAGDANLLAHLCPEPKYEGDQDWYPWRNQHWGTKWDVSDLCIEDDTEDDTISISFSTAWAPPLQALHNWAVNDGRVSFNIQYWEPGAGFLGECAGDGDYLDDNYLDSTDDPDAYKLEAENVWGYIEDEEEPEPLTEWYIEGVKAKGLDK